MSPPPVGIDGTPSWAYDEDGYCVDCGNGHWKHHMPECDLRDTLDLADAALRVVAHFALDDMDGGDEWISYDGGDGPLDLHERVVLDAAYKRNERDQA